MTSFPVFGKWPFWSELFMILVSIGNKELHSETSLEGIGSSGHDFIDEFLVNVMTSSSVRMLNSVIVEIYSGYSSEPDESPGMA